jgi:hypothetical protein
MERVKSSEMIISFSFPMLHNIVSFYKQRRPTKRAPDAGDSAHIPSIFTRLSIFPVGRLRRPRPSAGNANRWAAE